MRGKRRSDNFYSIDTDENPFINDKVYPMTGLLTTTCLDQYIGAVYRPYSGYFKHDSSPTIDEKYSSIMKELEAYSDIMRENITRINDNKLKFLYDSYKELSSKMQESYDKVMKDVNKTDKKSKLWECNKDLAEMLYSIKDDIVNTSFGFERKKVYLEALEKILTDEIIHRMNVFDKYGNGTGILMDVCEVTCISKKYGIIVKPDSKLNKNEREVIKQSASEIFKCMEKSIGMKFDNIFVQYMHITMTFGNRPIGLLMTDKFMCPEGSLVDYYNSREVREMLDNGFLYNYLSNDEFEDMGNDDDLPYDDDDDDDLGDDDDE